MFICVFMCWSFILYMWINVFIILLYLQFKRVAFKKLRTDCANYSTLCGNEVHGSIFCSFPQPAVWIRLRMQKKKGGEREMNWSLFIPAGLAEGGKSIEQQQRQQRQQHRWQWMERIKSFLKELWRGANDPDHRIVLHVKKVGSAASGWMQRERLFTSMKCERRRAAVGWGSSRRGGCRIPKKCRGFSLYAGVRIFRKSRWEGGGERKAQEDFQLSFCRLFVFLAVQVFIYFLPLDYLFRVRAASHLNP